VNITACFLVLVAMLLTSPTLATKKPAKYVTNSAGMKFVWISAGSFQMGSTGKEKGRGDDEIHHQVTFTKGFYLSVHPVTQAQWQTVMGTNPSHFKGDKLPVESVSWHDCQAFCKKLREKDNSEYRLPTEAEWEYAARAGTTTPFHFGSTLSTELANYNGGFVYGPGKKGVYREKTTPVGSFLANTWGLHDMHGNVWQWCHDWHGGLPGQATVDPQGPKAGKNRILRGGSWGSHPVFCRSANRNFADPDERTEYYGFRVAFTPK